MRHAQIENGVVSNVIIIEDPSIFPELTLVASETASIGDLYADGVFTPAPITPFVPQEITMRQARLVLLREGLLSGVSTAINALPSPQKEAAQIEWEYSNALQRQNPFVLTLGPALGLNPEQVDALFIEGAKL